MARTNERLIAGINNLPEVTRDDAGKVLGVNEDGKWVVKPDSGSILPEVTEADAGKVLAVDEQGNWNAEEQSSSDLPEVTSADEGKVLKVNSSGEWDKAEAKGVEIITLSTEDGTALMSALTQFVTAAIEQAGSPVRTKSQVSFSAYDDIMAAIEQNKVVYVKNTVGIEATAAITQYINGLFTFSVTNMAQPVGNVTVAYTVTISVNGVEIYCYGFATVVS